MEQEKNYYAKQSTWIWLRMLLMCMNEQKTPLSI